MLMEMTENILWNKQKELDKILTQLENEKND